MNEVKQLLRRISLFRGLSDDQLDRVAQITRSETHPADAVIFEQDETGDKMYLVQSGQVEIRVKDHAGVLSSVLIMGQGQIFGEMALLDHGARSASVVSLQPTTLNTISGDDFKGLCQEDTAIGYVMMRNLALDLSFKIRHQNSFS
ncbi:MAG: cyclic nucleotide-binding domain-containing protein [Anaerolineae bacterium]|nr:cyclic nucleotide-binding domain-containing protein [Anaerolineae bacterium]